MRSLGFEQLAISEKPLIAVDFDGCVAYGGLVKISYANAFFKEELDRELTLEETAEERFPPGLEKYRQMMDVVGSARIMEYELAPGCREVLGMLVVRGHTIVVITSRFDIELYAAYVYAEAYSLPLSCMFNTNRGSKRGLVERLKPAAFLDDSLSKLEQLIGTGTALYFLKQVWNKHEWQRALELEQQGLIAPVNDWWHFYSHVAGANLATARVINHA